MESADVGHDKMITHTTSSKLFRGVPVHAFRGTGMALLAVFVYMNSAYAQHIEITEISPLMIWTSAVNNLYCGLEVTDDLRFPMWGPFSERYWNNYVTNHVGSADISSNAETAFFRVQASSAPLYADPSTLHGKVMCGYQGWHGTTNDSSSDAWWRHWCTRDALTVDLWPDMVEYPSNQLCAIEFTNGPLLYANGQPARVYSSYHYNTVALHMKWLRDYCLDGVFLQRFVTTLYTSNSLAFEDQVTSNVRDGSEAYGRVFAVMYDIVDAIETNLVAVITNDWAHLVDDLNLTDSVSYLRHKGKPVVAFCGVGYADRPGTAQQFQSLLDWFGQEAATQYQATVLGNVATHWRTLDGDSKTNEQWFSVYRNFDVLSPWTVGRYTNSATAEQFAHDFVSPDIAETGQAGVDYMPVVFPGFSWHNLKEAEEGRYAPLNEIPRMGGQFMWTQCYEFQDAGATMLYVAMFDEVDEGTAIYKLAPTTNDLPVDVTLLSLDADGETLPSDWYLRVAREVKRMLVGQVVPTESLPIEP